MDDEYDENPLTETVYEIGEHLSIPVYADVQRYPCSNCGRAFNVESLRKHQPICQKTSQKQSRKVFDMGKQRATGSDVPYAATRETTKFYNEGIKPKSITQKKSKNHWREDHQALVQTIRQAREVSKSIEADVPVPNGNMNTTVTRNPPSSDYIQCEYCQRIFNPVTAERHIPFCETQFKRKQMQLKNNSQRSPPGTVGKAIGRAQVSHQINSAPSSFIPKSSPGKLIRRAPPNPSSTLKRTPPTQSSKATTNGSSPRSHPNRLNKAGNYLLGMMRTTGRTAENDDSNGTMTRSPGQTVKPNDSPHVQRRTTTVRTRSPSPSRRSNPPINENEQKISPNAAKHCHQCGEAFPVQWAKYCCECGVKRIGIE